MVGTSESKPDSNDKMEDSLGWLVQLLEMTKSFLEAAFSTAILNEDCKK